MFNKMDRVADPFEKKRLSVAFPHALFVSAFSAPDMALLKGHIGETVISFNKERAKSDIIAHATKEITKDQRRSFQ